MRLAFLVYIACGCLFVGVMSRRWFAEYEAEATRLRDVLEQSRFLGVVLLLGGVLLELALWPHSVYKAWKFLWWPSIRLARLQAGVLKMERDLVAAQQRMIGCAHEQAQYVDIGAHEQQLARQCLKCWALELPDVGTGGKGWAANITSPKTMRAQARDWP